jgi:hypothetical protein
MRTEWKPMHCTDESSSDEDSCNVSGLKILRTSELKMHARRPSTSPKNISSTIGDSEFSINLPSVSSPDVSKDLEALQYHHKGLFDDEDSADLKSEEDHAPPTQTFDVVEQRKITLNDAEKLLEYYRIKASFFPFVRIENGSTVRSLARTSPFLLLAILTSASIKDPPLFHQMDHEFRRILSLKVSSFSLLLRPQLERIRIGRFKTPVVCPAGIFNFSCSARSQVILSDLSRCLEEA